MWDFDIVFRIYPCNVESIDLVQLTTFQVGRCFSYQITPPSCNTNFFGLIGCGNDPSMMTHLLRVKF
ncbi:hypothetical protein CW304_28885 [Bacillus sp. UFRGS-B20]|nr:hypothetical protein CW304_28885 [Bacillus sp. UFRGS-B20]